MQVRVYCKQQRSRWQENRTRNLRRKNGKRDRVMEAKENTFTNNRQMGLVK
jgi:hypothetical protein